MGNYIFFPVPSPLLPPSLAIPLFALHATVPSVLTIFSILLLFFIGIASGNLYRGESINPSLSDATKEKTLKTLLKTITYYFMHKLKLFVTCTIIICKFCTLFPCLIKVLTYQRDSYILLSASSCSEKGFLDPRIKSVLSCTSFPRLQTPCGLKMQNISFTFTTEIMQVFTYCC